MSDLFPKQDVILSQRNEDEILKFQKFLIQIPYQGKTFS